MKNCNEMLDSLLERREKYLADQKRKKKLMVGILVPVCSLVLCLVIGIGVWKGDFFAFFDEGEVSAVPKKPESVSSTVTKTSSDTSAVENEQSTVTSSTSKWPEKVIEYSEDETTQEMTARVPKWDELTIAQQYIEVDYNGVMYSSKNKTISKDMLFESLGEYTAVGIDEYTDTRHEKKVTAYSVKNLSQSCVIAVCFEDSADFYIYTNPFYKPETLGDFISDLNLKEIMGFGSVWYDNSYFKGEDYIYERIEFTDLADEKVWEMLLSDTSLKNVYDVEKFAYPSLISVSVNISLLGYENISIWITEDYYLETNILDTGKGFFLGKEKSEEFIDYVINNCTGYKIVYKNTDQEVNDEEDNHKSTESGSVSSYTVSKTVE